MFRSPPRTLAAAITAIALLAPPARAADPRESEVVETSQVDVVEAWPFVVRAKRKADEAYCRGLGPEALRIAENDKDVRVLAVTRAPPLSAHVLLIDTSASMTNPNKVISRRRGRQAKAAGRAYVDWMLESAGAEGPPPELMLLTFDDDLIMRVPPTRIVEGRVAREVVDSIRGINGGYLTGLNDAIYRTVDFLSTREGRSVVILLSDGVDHGSRRTAQEVALLTQRANNVTLFAIGIGLGRGPFVDFLERVARSSGGRYFGVRGAPAELARRLDGRFAEIHARLASQLYGSWLTAVLPGASGEPTDVRIESVDRRCRVPDDGYRRFRAAAMGRSTAPTEPSSTPGAATDGSPGSLELTVTDTVFDGDPLVRYAGESHRPMRAERFVRLQVSPARATAPTAAGGLEATMHAWLLTDRLPLRDAPGSFPVSRDAGYPVVDEINGKTLLDLRDALAGAVFATQADYREWALERARARVRARFLRLLPPPDDPQQRAAYERRLEATVHDRVREIGAAAYREDLAAWFGDVPARELADRLERFEANRLLVDGALAVPEVDRAQSQWVRLHDWLRIPDRVRITAPLVLTCRGSGTGPQADGPCGFHRIVLPRLGELPEDLSRPTGKTMEPTAFDAFLELERIKVPRRPFGLMTVRWLLGLPPEPGSTGPGEPPAPSLRDGWRLTDLRHAPEPVEGDDRVTCARRVRLELVRGATTARLVLLFEGRLAPAEPRRAIPDPCEALPGPVSWSPRCVVTASGAGPAVQGVPRCP